MKKILLIIAVLSAASLSFAGGDKSADKEKCDAKCEKACCKSDKDSKDGKACADDKADARKDGAAAKTEKK